mgnify:CR=1 FL=1
MRGSTREDARGGSRRMRGGSRREARGLEEDVAGDSGEARRQREETTVSQVWAAAAEEVIGDDGESRYLATERSSAGLVDPWWIPQLGGVGPWRRAGDGRRKKTGRRDLFETLLKPRGFFCKITSELRLRHVFWDRGST